jgi:uncharacterized OsmC-like protein
MNVAASIISKYHKLECSVETDDSAKEITITPKTSGFGSSVSGAELLLLSLATCFCNDVFREAGKRNMKVSAVKVTVTGEFGAEGAPGSNFRYQAQVSADASPPEIEELIRHTDRVAEIQNTLRKGLNIELS